MITIGDYTGRDYLRTSLTREVQQRLDGPCVRVVTRNEVRHPGIDPPFSHDYVAVKNLLEETKQDIGRLQQASKAVFGIASTIVIRHQLNIQFFAATGLKSQLEEFVRQHGGATATRAGRA